MKRILLGVLASAMLLGGYCFGQTTFYIAAGGNDSRTDLQGQSSSTPFKTPNRVQTAIHDITVTAGSCALRGAVTVYFKTGAFYLGNSSTNPSGTWTIAAGDTCSASPITYSNWVVGGVAQDAGNPILSGGIQLGKGLATWTTHTTSSGATLWSTASIPLSATGSFSPEALYYQVAGSSGVPSRRFRTRSSATSGNLAGTFPLVAATQPNGRIPSTSANYDSFTYTAGDWPDTVAAASNYSCWNPNSQSSGCAVTIEPTYGGDIEVIVFEKWTMARERISAINTTTHVVYLLGSTRTTTDHGYIKDHRYMIENYISRDALGFPVLLPGQFFIDRSNQTLYYMPNSGETPSSDSVVLPVLSSSGTSGALLAATGIQYVTFTGLTFENDNYAPPQAGYGPGQSDVTLPAMVTCLDCSHTTWTGDIFTQTTGHALAFQTDQSGTATPTTNDINGNYFYNLGGDGIMYGGLPQNSDSATNILGNGQIESNLVQGFGRMYAGSSGIEHPFGYDTTIENNDVNDGYQTGIGVCIPAGVNCGGTTGGGSAYGIAANYNHVWNVGKGVTDDLGALYIATYGAGSSSNRNQVKNNWLHDVNDSQVLDPDGYGGNGIYVDNTTGNIDVENNLVYRVTSHSFQNTQGPYSTADPNYINNNIFSYGRVAMFYDGAPSTGTPNALTETISNNIFYFDGNGARSSCETQEQDSKFCTFTIQADCTVLNTTTSFANASQQYSENIYYNPYSSNSTWASGSAFFTVTAPSGGVLCPKSSGYTFTNWQNLYTSPKQDASSVAYNNSNTNPFKHPYCTDSTPDTCLSDSTKQDDYSQATGFTIPTAFTFFNAALAGRQSGGTYPLCPTYAACPGTVIDTFPPTTFSLTSTGTNVITSY
jgi:hypothetical protein